MALVVLAAGAYFGYQRASGGLAADSYIEIHAVPWGTVRSVSSLDGKIIFEVNQQTPVRVNVPPGTYKVVVTGPHGEEKSEEVEVFANQPGSYSAVFQTLKKQR